MMIVGGAASGSGWPWGKSAGVFPTKPTLAIGNGGNDGQSRPLNNGGLTGSPFGVAASATGSTASAGGYKSPSGT